MLRFQVGMVFVIASLTSAIGGLFVVARLPSREEMNYAFKAYAMYGYTCAKTGLSWDDCEARMELLPKK